MSDYTSLTSPDLDPEYKLFFEAFYKLSDTHPSEGGTADVYAARFTPDATFNLAGRVAHGTEQIKAIRDSMWSQVSSRQHRPVKIFTLGKHSNEVMIYGDVQYTAKDGQSSGKEWAARAELSREGGEVRLSFYQIYM